MDFCYAAQAEEINEDSCEAILASINKFHQQKSGIMNMKTQVGKGNRPINNWYIPKLELMQSIVPNIQANGIAIQYSTNATSPKSRIPLVLATTNIMKPKYAMTWTTLTSFASFT